MTSRDRSRAVAQILGGLVTVALVLVFVPSAQADIPPTDPCLGKAEGSACVSNMGIAGTCKSQVCTPPSADAGVKGSKDDSGCRIGGDASSPAALPGILLLLGAWLVQRRRRR